MSTFNDYKESSKVYDEHRNAVGTNIMTAMMHFHCGKQLKDLVVLDAGCGTGNYAKQFLDYGVGHVTLLDASPGMLEKAKEKLSNYIQSGRVNEIVTAKMPPIPLADNAFDVVVFNVVLHHLEDNAGERNFTNTTATLREAKRVLKPNGLIIISTVFPDAMSNIWYTQVIPGPTERIKKLLPDADEYDTMFRNTGLKYVQKMTLLGVDILRDYYNLEGPFDESWRASTSFWSTVTDDELTEIQDRIRDMKKNGRLEQWVKEHDHSQTAGFLTVLMLTHAKK